jgi:hypothetical protein
MPKGYPVASRAFDAKRSKRGWSSTRLKLYLGREAIHMLIADELYREQTGQEILSPGLRTALKQVRDHTLRGK